MSKGQIVSLFSGAGGLDMGFKQAGYEIVFANDVNEKIKPTYDVNHDIDLTIEDIQELEYDDIPDCDGIIGGPPCQSWSLAGNMKGTDDKRGSLFYNYIDIIDNKQPDFFVAENVPGILSKNNIDEFKDIIQKFNNIGYDVHYKKMNAAYFDVPQRRKRVIIIGIREDLQYDYQFPSGSDTELSQEDAIQSLPSSKPTDGGAYKTSELNFPNHEHYVGGFSSRFMSRDRVRDWSDPAYTVQANARHQKIHPKAPHMVKIQKDEWEFKEGYEDEYRRYSVREAARLQTFPDDFTFYYDKVNTGYKMIGNAVPVNLAESIANSIKNTTVKQPTIGTFI